MATLTLQPIQDAIDKLSSRTPVGSTLKSAEWSQVPVEIRERAQFSSQVESARVLQRIQKGLANILSGQRNEFGVIEDRSKFIAELARIAEAEGLSPTEPAIKGGLQDITSEARADLIVRTQTEMAYNFARHKRGSSGPLLNAAPAQELVRIAERQEKRRWVDVWRANGGQTFGGRPSIGGELQEGMGTIRCIALKGDPIWNRISRFGVPWPPFDFGSGVGVTNVTRTEAIALGLIQPNTVTAPPQVEFNSNLEVDVSQMEPGILTRLLQSLGSLAELSGNMLRWKGAGA